MTNNPYDHVGIHSGAHFDGESYNPSLDHIRLTGQLARVYNAMKDGRWRTLHHLSVLAKCPESSASARLRDMRKEKFGGYEVERKRDTVQAGLFLYRLIVETEAQGRLF